MYPVPRPTPDDFDEQAAHTKTFNVPQCTPPTTTINATTAPTALVGMGTSLHFPAFGDHLSGFVTGPLVSQMASQSSEFVSIMSANSGQ
jgi:hypothetical protein|mmetsp:Transcript_86808/g.144409  ORF Transcript_86808/g.144409 Transcript_86808/m.144409 type:complete len:89 (-) Transcript_86808:810-1076(-)